MPSSGLLSFVHLPSSHDNAWPRVAGIYTKFLEDENIPVFAWPTYSLPLLKNALCEVLVQCIIKVFLLDKLHILEWPFIVTNPRHDCAIVRLFKQHLDMSHVPGRWIILGKMKCSVIQILTNLREISLLFTFRKSYIFYFNLCKMAEKDKSIASIFFAFINTNLVYNISWIMLGGFSCLGKSAESLLFGFHLSVGWFVSRNLQKLLLILRKLGSRQSQGRINLIIMQIRIMGQMQNLNVRKLLATLNVLLSAILIN